jgi:Na+-transporting NADH:ubiquinone oxidoreductase subunit NqrC
MNVVTILVCVGVLVGTGWVALVDRQQQAQASEQQAKAEAERQVLCRAKLANWVMRYEELAKPEKERYESWREYMGRECVR